MHARTRTRFHATADAHFYVFTAVATSVGQRRNGLASFYFFFFFVLVGQNSATKRFSPHPRRRPAGNQKPTVAAPDGPENCETSVTRDVWPSGRSATGGWRGGGYADRHITRRSIPENSTSATPCRVGVVSRHRPSSGGCIDFRPAVPPHQSPGTGA